MSIVIMKSWQLDMTFTLVSYVVFPTSLSPEHALIYQHFILCALN